MSDVTDDASKYHALCIYCSVICGDHVHNVKAGFAGKGINYHCKYFRPKK